MRQGFARRLPTWIGIGPAWIFLLVWSACAIAASPSDLPTLYTDQQYIEDVGKQSSLEIGNIKSVLGYVLSQLPDTVKVYPTEDYYYFYFYYGGIKYAGNLRFDIETRDDGKVEFIYFKDSTDLMHDDQDFHALLGKSDGVDVEKVQDLVYKLTFQGRSVTFALNDLSDVRPSSDALGPDETFLGPIADESGIRFFLTFDEKLKIFHYVLDDTVAVSDELISIANFKHIQIGRRTSFAFFIDPTRKRKLLVGVFGPNSTVNSYLDGPFDQLPDNFLKGDELRRDLLLEDPTRDKSIDRLGISPGGEFRELIAPYMEYYKVRDLAPADKCAEAGDRGAIYLCLNALSSK